MESLRHKGSADLSVWSEICAKLLKVLLFSPIAGRLKISYRLGMRPWRSWIARQTPTLKAAGSNPVGRTMIS